MNSHEKLESLKTNLATGIRGKVESIEVLTITLIAGGLVRMEDVPDVGKTTLAKTLTREDILHIQGAVRGVKVEKSVAEYFVSIIQQTRSHADIRLGVSSRASLTLFMASIATAFSRGRIMSSRMMYSP